MALRALITRPHDDAVPLAERLAEMGFDSVIDPLLVIDIAAGPALDLHGVQAILITSANGARALARRTPERSIPLFAVGDASAEIARSFDFTSVDSAAGDVTALAALVKQRLSPARGSLLHVAGTRVAGNLAGDLEAAGFSLRREVLYAAHAAHRLADRTVGLMRAGGIGMVLLYSPRTAATFAALIRESGLEEACKTVTAFCLSLAVAEAAGDLPFADIRVADIPNQETLIATIEQWQAERNGRNA
ncbi:MAG: uroporphyrinogen-III synthase [Rhodospirillales bacterium]